MTAPGMECRNLTVAYGTEPVLDGLSLRVGAQETLAVLGPSGSGKTTLLYAVAGFLQPRGGHILLGGRLVAAAGRSLPPELRDVGVVFQNYALWPHLTALKTVAYPFRRRGVPAAEAGQSAAKLLERMGIGDLADRKPAELSGGQQQRVGVARALARGAALYLFDEPTAHLDAALRTVLQEELAEQRRSVRAAAVYATHDAAEALAVADRVALLRTGRLVQVGTPAEIYDQPTDLWAARLTGPASILDVHLDGTSANGLRVTLASETFVVQGENPPKTSAGHVEVLVRPDWTSLGGPLPGVVLQVWYRGPHTDYRLGTPGGEVQVREPGTPKARIGERVTWSLHRVWVPNSV